MARPSTPHQGFLIPNASDVGDPILAEPDKIDFNTLANSRWGVLTGCLVTGNGGSSVSVSEGTAMVDGKFVVVEAVGSGLNVTVPIGSPHFSLVVVNDSGAVRVISGRDSTDPVFPDPARNETVLAAVYCKTGQPVADSIIDKRKFLAPALLTKVGAADDLIRNFQQSGTTLTDPAMNYYRVLGSGETIWSNDTRVFRSTAKTLRVEDDLSVKQKITAGDDIKGLTITATENVTALNLRRQGSAPDTPRLSDLWQSTSTGAIYVGNTKGDGSTLEWDEISTHNGTLPPGTIINSLEEPTRMKAAGWLPMDGRTPVTEHEYPNLFKVAALRPYFTGGTVAPNRTMTLPNLSGRVLMADLTNAGFRGPVIPGTSTLRSSNDIKLSISQMPTHHHASEAGHGTVATTAGVPGSKGWVTRRAGATDLSVAVGDATLKHSHGNTDEGHSHEQATAQLSGATLLGGSAYPPTGTSVFTPSVAGRVKAKLDEAFAGIKVNEDTQTHKHVGTPTDVTSHYHDMDVFAIGGGGAISITPNYFTTYVYIKA